MILRISADEHLQRLERLHQEVKQRDLDLFIVSSFESIFYLTGAGFEPLERPFFLLVRPDTSPVLLVPALDLEHMKKATTVAVENTRTYWEYPAPVGRGWPDRLRDEIGNVTEVGIEPTVRQEIVQELREYSFRVEPLVEKLRLVKSRTEVEMIRRAARYADFGVRRLRAASYFGSTVAEGFAETRTVTVRIIREVDDWQPLTSQVVMATWAAPRSAVPHSIPDLNDRLREGPHVALVLTKVNGYAAESERTYFTSSPSRLVRHAFDAMMQARSLALGMIRPGLSCDELDQTVNEFLQQEGYGRECQRLHRTGHGIGLGNHEGPWIAEGSQDRLAENMVISVEPGIYLPGHGGVRHSDTVLVTEDGYRTLTNEPDDLESLLIRGRKPYAQCKGWFVRNAFGLSRKAQLQGGKE